MPLVALKTEFVRPADVAELAAIDRAVYGDCGWAEDEMMCQAKATARGGAVWRRPEGIGAYLFYVIRAERLQILRFVVKPGYRRERIGSALFVRAIYMCRWTRKPLLTSCVPETADGGIAFCRAVGMTATMTIPGRFGDAAGIRFEYRI